MGLIVHTLWNQLLLELLLDLFNTDILKMCKKKFDAEKNVFRQIDRVFNLAIFWQMHLVNNCW